MSKGLIFDIRRFTVHDGPGIRTTVFFKGCPLECWWCHNPESQRFEPAESVKTLVLEDKKYKEREITGQWMTVEEVMKEIISDRIFYEESFGGVTISGGEPLVQDEFLVELLKACKSEGLHTAIDTSGIADRAIIDTIIPYTDLFLYDIKLMDEADHIMYTGVSNKTILGNLVYLLSIKKDIIIRIPVIPGITDTRHNLREVKIFLLQQKSLNKPETPIRIDFLPYHTIGKSKYSRFNLINRISKIKDLSEDLVLPLKKEFEAEGFSVKIGG